MGASLVGTRGASGKIIVAIMSTPPLRPVPFPPGKLLVPVLHMICPPGAPVAGEERDGAIVAHTLSQAGIAVRNGADGLALIGSPYHFPNAVVCRAAVAVGTAFPALPLVVNFMCDPRRALEDVPDHAHLWTDQGVDARGLSLGLADAPRRAGWEGVWLAGFYHKGSQRDFSVTDAALSGLADLVLTLSPLPITSGAGTGKPPVPEEVGRLRAALAGRARLANASGVTVDNVGPLLPHLDVFLVATGIEMEVEDPVEREFFASAGIPGARCVAVRAARPATPAPHHAAAPLPLARLLAATPTAQCLSLWRLPLCAVRFV